ncbi:MAG: hypothetical protein ACE5F7_00980 [Nitrospiria bacterium]
MKGSSQVRRQQIDLEKRGMRGIDRRHKIPLICLRIRLMRVSVGRLWKEIGMKRRRVKVRVSIAMPVTVRRVVVQHRKQEHRQQQCDDSGHFDE